MVTIGGQRLFLVPLIAGLGFCAVLNPYVFALMARREGRPDIDVHRVGTAVLGGLFVLAATAWVGGGADMSSSMFPMVYGLGLVTIAAWVFQSVVEVRRRRAVSRRRHAGE